CPACRTDVVVAPGQTKRCPQCGTQVWAANQKTLLAMSPPPPRPSGPIVPTAPPPAALSPQPVPRTAEKTVMVTRLPPEPRRPRRGGLSGFGAVTPRGAAALAGRMLRPRPAPAPPAPAPAPAPVAAPAPPPAPAPAPAPDPTPAPPVAAPADPAPAP